MAVLLFGVDHDGFKVRGRDLAGCEGAFVLGADEAREPEGVLLAADELGPAHLQVLPVPGHQPVALPEADHVRGGEDLPALDVGDVVRALFKVGDDVGGEEDAAAAVLDDPPEHVQQVVP